MSLPPDDDPSHKYILRDKVPVPEPDLFKWAKWFGESRAERIVKQEDVEGHRVSTVFLGLDHGFDEGRPIIFETMVFPGDSKSGYGDSLDYCDRCSTWDEALLMHHRACLWVLAQTEGA